MTPENFRTARKALGLSQKELAKALRMGTHGWQTISKWESDSFDGTIPGPVQVAMEFLSQDRARTLATPLASQTPARSTADRRLGLRQNRQE